MKYLKQLLKEKSIWFLMIPFLAWMLFMIVKYGKGPSHLMVNQWHSEWADQFFKYITHLGDGAIFAVVIVILAFYRLRWSLYLLFASLFTLLFVFITKQIIFNGMPRPTKYFENQEVLHLVAGVKMHSWNTFPSGHTITAFAIFMILVLVTKKEYFKYVFVLAAIFAGYSRVYLSQHFLGDVLSGAIIGTAIAVISCALVDNWSLLNKGQWMDKDITQLFARTNEQ
ncbi:phosphatase PAP2 family protein [Lutimonas saemankumensis]|uniref:phosphatase PAP2 family protein n=1 Tax=Lutimonas saemankumensis TaxID=483016 RepID=UPI001CD679BA|nr:phosphatase PAP2 family protein [Lutimonas saemankumensis]MCA0932581.1 phosphatase PAP2 family protein [Lutimonas saemankumensis]